MLHARHYKKGFSGCLQLARPNRKKSTNDYKRLGSTAGAAGEAAAEVLDCHLMHLLLHLAATPALSLREAVTTTSGVKTDHHTHTYNTRVSLSPVLGLSVVNDPLHHTRLLHNIL